MKPLQKSQPPRRELPGRPQAPRSNAARPQAGPPAPHAKHPATPNGRPPRTPAAVLQPKTAQPKIPTAFIERRPPKAPAVYRPQLPPKVLQPKASAAPPAVKQVTKTPTAPPVYRPQPAPAATRPPATPGALPTGGAAIRRPVAPSVYRPQQQPPVQPKLACAARPCVPAENRAPRVGPHAPKGVPPARPASPQPPGQSGTIQRVIIKGTSGRSRKKLGLKRSDWYNKKLNKTQQAFAEALHREPDNFYTQFQAQRIIDDKISKGETPPTFTVSPKEVRMKRVRSYVNDNAPKDTDTSFTMGKVLSQAGHRAYRRHSVKYIRLREQRFDDTVEQLNDTKPDLYKNQKPLLKNFSEWERVFLLTHSDPKSYEFDFGGEKVTLDSLKVKSHDERSKKRKREVTDADKQKKKRKKKDFQPTINLAQVFIGQDNGDDSYWKLSDSTSNSFADSTSFKMLRHLESEREGESAFTNYLKDILFKSGKMTNKEAYGDENLFTFQEYKGALSATTKMKRIQTASSYQVLMRALKEKDVKLGRKIGKRPLTSASALFAALNGYMKKQTDDKYKVLVKEIYRLIRTQTREDMGSDTEDDEI